MSLRFDFIAKLLLSILLITACTGQKNYNSQVQAVGDAELCSDTVELNVAKDQKI